MYDCRYLLKTNRGVILPIALIYLLMISVAGTLSTVLTTTDLQMADYSRNRTQALRSVESGVAEALARLRRRPSETKYIGDPGASIDPYWSAYLLSSTSWDPTKEPEYNSDYKNYIPTTANHTNTSLVQNSLQSNISYLVGIRHMREYDAEQAGHTTSSQHYFDGDGSTSTHGAGAPGNVIYYGYGDAANPTDAVLFTTSGTTLHKPVETIIAYSDVEGSQRSLIIDSTYDPGPLIWGTVYSKRNIFVLGYFWDDYDGISVDGNDACAVDTAKPPFATKKPRRTYLYWDYTTDGNPTTPIRDKTNIDIEEYIDGLKRFATTVITQDETGKTYGSAGRYEIFYSNTASPFNLFGLTLSNATGYGILLVEGNLTLSGQSNWNGFIVVDGTLTIIGNESGTTINGALLADREIYLYGEINITYNSCVDDDVLTETLAILNWNETW